MGLHLHDDNPSMVDLLGFDAVVTPVVSAIRRPGVEPLTIGVRGGWGSGKSTLLKLVGQSFTRPDGKPDPNYLLITVDPWEFENAEELRSTLVEMVLTEIRERVGKDKTISPKLRRLIGRVRFGKIATAALKGMVAFPLDGGLTMLGQLVRGMGSDIDSFVGPEEEEPDHVPANMRGFRREFADLIGALHEDRQIEKVVVLVDDLDRCLPDAVVESLEAIKLFLAVERMVFVLAADEALVRSAIRASLAGTGRASDFADLYLEKIVQLPLTVPSLTHDDAITYATLVLSSEEDEFVSLCEHCGQRRSAGLVPTLDEAPHSDTTRLHELLARQVCDGLRTDRVVNPRQIKRFLNSFAVRASIAESRGIRLSPAVAAKLMLLEEQQLNTDFKVLVETPGPDVRDLLRAWEAWARNEDGAERPSRVSEGSRSWAASQPSLAASQDDLSPYFALAASFTASTPGGLLTSRVARIVDVLLGSEEDEVARSNAFARDLPSLDDPEVEQIMMAIAQQAMSLPNPYFSVRLIVELAEARPTLAQQAATIIDERLTSAVHIAVCGLLGTCKLPAIHEMAVKLAVDPRVDEVPRQMLKAAVGQAG